MIACRYSQLLAGLLPFALAACMNSEIKTGKQSAAIPLGIDLGSSGSEAPVRPGVAPPGEGHERTAEMPGGMKTAHQGHQDAHAASVVNTADPARQKINIGPNPIHDRAEPGRHAPNSGDNADRR